MWGMFGVRTPRVPCPSSPPSRGSSACGPLKLRPPPLPHALAPAPSGPRTSPSFAYPAFNLGRPRRPSTSR
eukprot:scaffold18824_cov49-Phaeocystis_antarctica.AAC.1